MHDSMQYDQIQGQGHEPFTVWKLAVFYLHHLQWELATDYHSLTRAQYLNLIGLYFWYSAYFCEFEVRTNVSSEESTVSPVWG